MTGAGFHGGAGASNTDRAPYTGPLLGPRHARTRAVGAYSGVVGVSAELRA